MPQIGQFPGVACRTWGCMGQVYRVPASVGGCTSCWAAAGFSFTGLPFDAFPIDARDVLNDAGGLPWPSAFKCLTK